MPFYLQQQAAFELFKFRICWPNFTDFLYAKVLHFRLSNYIRISEAALKS